MRRCVTLPRTRRDPIDIAKTYFHVGNSGSDRMKSLLRSFVYWPNMDNHIENEVKLCKVCAMAAKAPPIKFNPWLKTDLHGRGYTLTGPLGGFYYFIVVNSFSKWSEVHRCKTPTTEITIECLHELFARFGVVDTMVSDNGSQFREFKDIYEYQIDHVTTPPPLHPRSKGQAERFVDTLKRALKKVRATPTEKVLQRFLQVYRITPNNKTPALQSPADIILARRIQSVYDIFLPKQTKLGKTNTVPTKRYNPGERLFLNF